MKGGNRKNSRREAALIRRLKDLQEYTAAKNTDKAKKAYRDVLCTSKNLNKEIPSEAKSCLNQLGLKESEIYTVKIQTQTPVEEVPEEVLGVSK